MTVNAELKRRNSSNVLVPWLLNDDGTDPVADAAVRDKLDELIDLLQPSTYDWFQGLPDDVWTITHNLGFMPSVDVIRSDGAQVIGFAVQHITNNQLTVTFSGAMSGMARLS